jgi:nucleoside-diphosphate-sugar epimerase
MDEISNDAEDIINKIDFRSFNGKSILLTGASGLMGTYFLSVLQRLVVNTGIDLKVFVSTKSGEFSISVDSSVEVILGDLTRRNIIEKMPNFDLIIHGAGYGQPDKFLDNPFTTIELNSTCTLELMKKTNIGGRFLFISTSEVYSGNKNIPYSEDEIGTTNTNHLRAPYIESKRLGETLVAIAHKQNKINGVSARLALAYGPGTKKDDGRVLNSFIRQSIVNSEINILDMGKALRTYCYVSDAIELCFAAMISGKKEIYNIGGQSIISIAELAQKVAGQTKSVVIFPEKDIGSVKSAPANVSLNIDKILKISGKQDFIDINEGLSRTINWQRNNLYKTLSNEKN